MSFQDSEQGTLLKKIFVFELERVLDHPDEDGLPLAEIWNILPILGGRTQQFFVFY